MSLASVILAESSLLSYWAMEEGSGTAVADSGPGGHDGTFGSGPPVWVTGLTVDSTEAVRLPNRGRNYRVDMGDVSAFNFAGTAAFSVECIVQVGTSGLDPSGFGRFIQKDSFQGWNLLCNMGGTDSGFRFERAGNNVNSGSPSYHNASAHHVVATYDGTTMKLYVDGALVASGASGSMGSQSGRNFTLGAEPGNDNGATLSLDDVAIYTAALDATAVSAHYAAAFPPQIVAPSGIAPTTAVGTPSLLETISPTGIASTLAVGTPTVTGGAQVIAPTGIDSSIAVGSPTVVFGPQVIAPSGAPPSGAVGAPAVLEIPAGQPPTVPYTGHLDQIIDPVTSETYDFPISHASEGPVSIVRDLRSGGPNQAFSLVRQQSVTGGLALTLDGTVLDPAQHAKLLDFFERCEDRTLVYKDYGGDEYEVVVTSYNHRRRRTLGNPFNPALKTYWSYSLTMEVIHIRSSAYAYAVID